MKILWSPTAVADLREIRSFIGREQPAAANRIAQRIQASVARPRSFPLSGRDGRETGTREVAIAGTPYLAVYVITQDEIRIAAVLHGKQLWPKVENDQESD